jgi:hypothetical protein
MQWVTSKVNGWGRPNLVCKGKEKTLKGRWKGGMIGEQKAKHPPLGPHNQTCIVQIKSHVRNDVGKKMIIQSV